MCRVSQRGILDGAALRAALTSQGFPSFRFPLFRESRRLLDNHPPTMYVIVHLALEGIDNLALTSLQGALCGDEEEVLVHR